MVAGFRWVERLQPWAMMEVYLLGVIVAYVKLQDLATVHLGVALYAFVGTIILMAAADARFEPHAIWRRLAPQARADVLDPVPGHHAAGVRAMRPGRARRRGAPARAGMPALRRPAPPPQARQPEPQLGARA